MTENDDIEISKADAEVPVVAVAALIGKAATTETVTKRRRCINNEGHEPCMDGCEPYGGLYWCGDCRGHTMVEETIVTRAAEVPPECVVTVGPVIPGAGGILVADTTQAWPQVVSLQECERRCREARVRALEEAAKLCDLRATHWESERETRMRDGSFDCSETIRKLKGGV